jgi:hypothetical protein
MLVKSADLAEGVWAVAAASAEENELGPMPSVEEGWVGERFKSS